MNRLSSCYCFRAALVLLLLVSAPLWAVEKILHFDSNINLHHDGSITVVETIDVWAEGRDIKRGIYRDFPTRYRNDWAIERRTGFKVVSVLLDGEPTSMMRQDMINGQRVYMGDKNRYLSHGRHRFQLTYRSDHQLRFFDEYDEFYWNVTGNGWSFPINQVTATLRLPQNGGETIRDIGGWTGYQGQQGDDFAIQSTDTDKNTLVFTTTESLSEHQGFTVGVSFEKGLFEQPGLQIGRFIQHNILWLSTLLAVIGLLTFMALAWLRHGRDPKKGVIIALFKPPKGISPAAINYLDNRKITNTTLTAAMLSLAVKGALRIQQKSQHYRLFKKQPRQSLSKGEKQVYKNLFADKKDELIINKNPNAKLAKGKTSLAHKLTAEYKDACFKNNRRYIISGWLMSFVCCLLFYVLYYGFEQGSAAYLGTFFVYLFAFVVAVVTLMASPVVVGILFLLVLLGSFSELMQWFVDVQVGLYFTLSMVALNILFTWLMQSPTLYGRQIFDQVAGLRLYISMAEEQRLNLMNPPEKNLAHYEALLPYAVALGLENRWAEKFSAVFATAEQSDTTDLPFSWYQGDGHQALNLTEQLSDFTGNLDSTVQKAADVPASRQSISSSSDGYGSYSSSYSSSYSTGSSFSSGGGFSGGGGGGGGGGGW